LDGKALQLLLGAILGQGVTVLVSPLLTRLFSPQEFGVLGAFTAIMTIFASLTTLRYELAFPTLKSDTEAFHLLVLCGISIAAMTVGTFAVTALLVHSGVSESPWLKAYWVMIPLGLACVGGYNVLASEAVRLGRYGLMASTRIWQGLTSASMQVGAGLLAVGPLGLLLGYVVGQSGGMLSIWRTLRQVHRPHHRVDLAASRELASRYRSLPLFSSWAGVLDAAGNGHLLTLMMGALYGVEIVGYIFLAERIIGRPLMMTANSLLSVYVGEVSRLRHTQPAGIRRVFRSVLLRQSAITLAWVAVVVLVLPYAVEPLFGASWGGATPILQLMAIACVPQSIMQSVGNTLAMLDRQSLAAAWSVARVIAIALAIYLPHFFGFDALHGLIVYAVLQALTQASLLLLMKKTIYALK